MDSASSGSFSKRYSSALERAASTLSGEIDFSFNSIGPPSLILSSFPGELSRIPNFSHQTQQWIVELIHYTFLEGDDCVIGDADSFGADLSAALRDIAQTESKFVFEQTGAGEAVEGMHLQACHADEETWASEFFFFLVVAEHMADVLAQETLYAFAEFLYSIYVRLVHFPFHAFPRLEGRDFLVHFVIPGNVRHQVLDHGEGFHG